MTTEHPDPQSEKPRAGFPYGLTIVTLIALAILMGLGGWQLKRLAWKQALLAEIAVLRDAPSRPINAVLMPGSRIDFARITAACPGLATAPFLSLYAVIDGQAGVRLISRCDLTGSSYGSVLVDRGFISDSQTERPSVGPAQDVLLITGILRQPDKASFVTPPPQNGQWYARDIAGMAKALKAPNPAPVFLFAETSSNPDLTALRPIAVPPEISNRHLEYALTWFGLAVALASVYVGMLIRRRRN
jgi:surfeit locus 1 family protein